MHSHNLTERMGRLGEGCGGSIEHSLTRVNFKQQKKKSYIEKLERSKNDRYVEIVSC